MKINISYPPLKKKKTGWYSFCTAMGWVFLVSSIITIVVNLVLGGKPWCLIAMFGMYMVWSMFISPSLVEYNRISQFTRGFILTILMLGIIEVFFFKGWAIFVIPIVMFGAITLLGILFFSNFSRQKENIFPIMKLLIASIIFSICGLTIKSVEIKWVFIVLLSESGLLFITLFIILNKKLIAEFKKRFSLK